MGHQSKLLLGCRVWPEVRVTKGLAGKVHPPFLLSLLPGPRDVSRPFHHTFLPRIQPTMDTSVSQNKPLFLTLWV